MSAITLLLEAVDRTVAYLQERQNRDEIRKDRVLAVWEVLRAAVVRTRAYLGDLQEDPSLHDRDEERALANSWNAVGLAIRGLGGPEATQLSDRCFEKANYWADPNRWDPGDRPDLDIRLEAVEDAARKALNEKELNA